LLFLLIKEEPPSADVCGVEGYEHGKRWGYPGRESFKGVASTADFI
jgi:hypothetical protein